MKILKFIYYPLILLSIFGALVIFAQNYNTPYQHFTEQARSFLQGRTDIPQPDHDAVFIDGKYYWPQGPFPSVVLLPFAAISPKILHQGTAQIILVFISAYLLFKLARLKMLGREDSGFLVAAFFLGSTVSGLVVDPKSWFFAQIVAVTFLIGLLYEFETKRRWWILGICEGALIATRPTSGYIILFLLFWILRERYSIRRKLSQLIQLFIPVGIAILALFALDYSRYGNILDNGYSTNDVGGYLEPLRNLGVFSLRHIPTNIYYYFLESVDPVTKNSAHLVFPFIKYNVWGLSFLIISPIFLYALKTMKKYWPLWVVVGITLLNLLTYYAPGWYQFGPRYTADFMPILFLLLLFAIPGKLSHSQKLLISLSCLFNVYLLFTSQFFPNPL